MVNAIAAGQTEARDILAAVTPGGGKSLLPVLAAARLIEAGIVERVCWVVPRDSLRLQAEEAFADPLWRAALGHCLSVRAAGNTPDPSRGLAGYVTTYQGIAAAPGLHLAEFRRYRTLLVVDEVHHLPALADTDPDTAAGSPGPDEDPAGAWSRAMLPLFECAAGSPAALRHAGAGGRQGHPVAALPQGAEGAHPRGRAGRAGLGRGRLLARASSGRPGGAAGAFRGAGWRGPLA